MKKSLLALFIALTNFHVLAQSSSFKTTWKTNNPGTSNSTSITVPTTGTGYNYDVDWNDDGIFDQIGLTGSVTHNFGVAGTYTFAIRGSFPRIYFNNTGDKEKLLNVNQWGTIGWTSMAGAFNGCINFDINATDTPNLTNVTDMSYMFANCNINGPANINSWNVSNVTNMAGMFYFNIFFNQNIGSWNVSNVTNMESMFSFARNFNQNIGLWNVSNVTDMNNMFGYDVFFNQDISSWNVSNVTNMRAMFTFCRFNQNITAWNVSKVTDMSEMFSSNINFNQNIGSWNVSNVTKMNRMFFGADSFNQNISAWNVSKVTNMERMFTGASLFNQNIGTWDVAKVTDMQQMFYSASTFNQNLGAWNIAMVSSLNNIFNYSGISRSNYDNILIAWDAAGYVNKTLSTPDFTLNKLKYCAGQTARTNLISKGWLIAGDVLVCSAISVNSGNWEAPLTWDIRDVPTNMDNVVISPNHTVNITTSSPVTKNLTISANAILKYINATNGLSLHP